MARLRAVKVFTIALFVENAEEHKNSATNYRGNTEAKQLAKSKTMKI